MGLMCGMSTCAAPTLLLPYFRLPMLSCLLNFGLDNLWLFVKKKTFWTEAPYGMRESTKSTVSGWLVICEWSRTHTHTHTL